MHLPLTKPFVNVKGPMSSIPVPVNVFRSKNVMLTSISHLLPAECPRSTRWSTKKPCHFPVMWTIVNQAKNWLPWAPGFSRVRREFWVSAKGRSHERRGREKKLFARVTINTWLKPETALEKSLAPRVKIGIIQGETLPPYKTGYNWWGYFLCSKIMECEKGDERRWGEWITVVDKVDSCKYLVK